VSNLTEGQSELVGLDVMSLSIEADLAAGSPMERVGCDGVKLANS